MWSRVSTIAALFVWGATGCGAPSMQATTTPASEPAARLVQPPGCVPEKPRVSGQRQGEQVTLAGYDSPLRVAWAGALNRDSYDDLILIESEACGSWGECPYLIFFGCEDGTLQRVSSEDHYAHQLTATDDWREGFRVLQEVQRGGDAANDDLWAFPSYFVGSEYKPAYEEGWLTAVVRSWSEASTRAVSPYSAEPGDYCRFANPGQDTCPPLPKPLSERKEAEVQGQSPVHATLYQTGLHCSLHLQHQERSWMLEDLFACPPRYPYGVQIEDFTVQPLGEKDGLLTLSYYVVHGRAATHTRVRCTTSLDDARCTLEERHSLP